MKRLKIGLVLDDSLNNTNSGVQQYMLVLAKWLVGRGHDVHFLVGETKGSEISNVHSLSRNVKVRFNGNRMSIPLPASKAKLKRILAEENFDVLHVQMPYSPLLAGRIINLAPQSAAIVATFHVLPDTSIVTAMNRLLAAITPRSRKRLDQVFAVSSSAKQFADSTYGLDCVVLPNVIDLPVFREAKPLKEFEKTKVIMFLGRLVPRKGCQVLLEAAAKLHSDCPELDFKLLICGKGPLRQHLADLAVQSGIGGFTTFTGYISDELKPRYYASADVVAFPSRSGESFGIVIAEALASGKSVVLAGDNPGYRAVLEQRPELLFNPTSSQDLVKLLKLYLTHEARRREQSSWGRDYARSFDVAKVGPEIEKSYYKFARANVLRA